MTRAGATKLGRMLNGEQVPTKYIDPKTGKENEFMRVVVTKKAKIDPATPRQAIEIEYAGHIMTELIAPGQIINSRKAYKRMMKRREEEWKNKKRK